MKIYIAGPMRGLPDFNYPAFDRWAARLRAEGWEVENPVEIGGRFGTAEEINDDARLLAAVLAADIHALESCDAVFLLRGWEKSEGARKETAAALAANLRVILEPFALREGGAA